MLWLIYPKRLIVLILWWHLTRIKPRVCLFRIILIIWHLNSARTIIDFRVQGYLFKCALNIIDVQYLNACTCSLLTLYARECVAGSNNNWVVIITGKALAAIAFQTWRIPITDRACRTKSGSIAQSVGDNNSVGINWNSKHNAVCKN